MIAVGEESGALDDMTGEIADLYQRDGLVKLDAAFLDHLRGADAALEEGGVDALGLVEAPRAHADRRRRAASAPGQELASV